MHCPIWRHLAPATRVMRRPVDTVKDSDAVWRRGETMKADKIVTECCGALLSSDNIKFHNEGKVPVLAIPLLVEYVDTKVWTNQPAWAPSCRGCRACAVWGCCGPRRACGGCSACGSGGWGRWWRGRRTPPPAPSRTGGSAPAAAASGSWPGSPETWRSGFAASSVELSTGLREISQCPEMGPY